MIVRLLGAVESCFEGLVLLLGLLERVLFDAMQG